MNIKLLSILVVLIAALFAALPTQAEPDTPEEVMYNAVQVSIGATHACALMRDGSVLCWGNGENDQLMTSCQIPPNNPGAPYTPPFKCPPMKVNGLPGKVRSVQAYSGNTCALMKDRTVVCWGLPYSTLLIEGLSDVKSFTMMGEGGCALTHNGDLYCWGRGNNECPQLYPFNVAFLVMQDVIDYDTNSNNLCMVTKRGEVLCLGNNEYGVVGNDGGLICTPTPITLPKPVLPVQWLPSINE